MTKKTKVFSLIAFICSVIATGFYASGIFYIFNDEYYAYAWLHIIGVFPIVVLLMTSLFIPEVKNTRKIPLIITVSLFAVSLIDYLSERMVCMPYAKDYFFYEIFNSIDSDEYITSIFSYVIFAFLLMLVPYGKAIWTKIFCIAEAVLNLVYILFYTIKESPFVRQSDYCISFAYILFFIGFFFVSLTMSINGYDFFEEDQPELKKTLDFSDFFNDHAYAEMVCTIPDYHDRMDYAEFYKCLKEDDFDAIKKHGYYGRSFAVEMVSNLKIILDSYSRGEYTPNIILLKCRVDKMYSLIDDVDAFLFEYYQFINLLKNGTEDDRLCEVVLNIRSNAEFPLNMLSNFASNSFVLDDVNISSMEGFLQSLKFKDIEKQRQICTLSGKIAKNAGKHHNFWKLTRYLYWNGKCINRYSKQYTELITRAYNTMAQSNPEFVKVLLSTDNKILAHPIGKEHKWQTILTEDEFVEEQLARLREKYKKEMEND